MLNVERTYSLTEQQGKDLGDILQTQYGPLDPRHEIVEVFGPQSKITDMGKDRLRVAPEFRIETTNGAQRLVYRRDRGTAREPDYLRCEVNIDPPGRMREILKDLGYMSFIALNAVSLEARIGEMTITHARDIDSAGDSTHSCSIAVLAEDEAAIPSAEAQIAAQSELFGYTEEMEEAISRSRRPPVNQFITLELPEEQ